MRHSKLTSWLGISWTKLKKFDVPLIGDYYNIVLAVVSKDCIKGEVFFENYKTDPYYFPSADPSSSPAPTIYIPSLDIVNVVIAGSAVLSNTGKWSVTAWGSDIWGSLD